MLDVLWREDKTIEVGRVPARPERGHPQAVGCVLHHDQAHAVDADRDVRAREAHREGVPRPCMFSNFRQFPIFKI